MVLQRSPPQSPPKVRPPTAFLAAVTRKQSEIEELLQDIPNNLPRIKTLFTEYLSKIENLQTECSDNPAFQTWLIPHLERISSFRVRVENCIHPIPRLTLQSDENISVASVSIGSSRTSNVSSARLKLAQKKAEVIAEREHLSENAELSKAQLRAEVEYKEKLLQIEAERRAADNKKLENTLIAWETELSKIENSDAQSVQNMYQNKTPSEVYISTPISQTSEPMSQPTYVTSNREASILHNVVGTTPSLAPIHDFMPINFIGNLPRTKSYPSTQPIVYRTPFKEYEHETKTAMESTVRVSSYVPIIQSSREQKFNPVISRAPHYFTPNYGQSTLYQPPQVSQAYSNQGDSVFNEKLLNILERQNEISLAVARGQESSTLPKREISIFDGTDLTKFRPFIISFERVIEAKCSNSADKLVYLEQYTAGKPQNLVKSCQHYNPVFGFERAKELLSSEYGNQFKIANAYINKIEKWPEVKNEDKEALQDLSIFLLDCSNYLDNMSMSNQLQNPRQIMSIVAKLPIKMRERWRRKVFSIQSVAAVTFQHLVEFVDEEVRILNQPLFGTIYEDSKPVIKRQVLTTSSKEDNKDSGSTKKVCLYCDKLNHYMASCRNFKALSTSQKSNVLKEKGLCFGCFGDNHFRKDCKKPLKCFKCEQQHPTILHDFYSEKPIREQSENPGNVPSQAGLGCSSTNSASRSLE